MKCPSELRRKAQQWPNGVAERVELKIRQRRLESWLREASLGARIRWTDLDGEARMAFIRAYGVEGQPMPFVHGYAWVLHGSLAWRLVWRSQGDIEFDSGEHWRPVPERMADVDAFQRACWLCGAPAGRQCVGGGFHAARWVPEGEPVRVVVVAPGGGS